MVSNQSEPGAVKAPVDPWRGRAASGLRLGPSVPSSMPPPPPFLVQPRTSSWPPPRKGSSFPPPPRLPLPLSLRTGDISDIDADWDDEKEDAQTNVFAEPVTLVTQKDGPGNRPANDPAKLGLRKDGWGEDESTHEIERPTQKRLPTIPPPPRALPPTGYEVLSASLAAASLAPQGFTLALEQHNALLQKALSLPARLPRRSLRVGAGVAVALAVAVAGLSRSPSPGKIVVEATDTTDAPVAGFDVSVDGTKSHCATAPCTLPATRGLHEIQIVGPGFEHTATQAVSVASGDATHAHFIVAAQRPEVAAAPEPPQAPEPASAPVAASAPEPAAPPESAPAAVHEAVPAPVAAAEPRSAPAQRSAPMVFSSVSSSRPPVASARPDTGAEAKASASAASPAASHVASHVAGAEAYLNINSMPASSCYLDGRALGFTPRMHVTTTAGAHAVRFRAADGTTKTLTVSVGAGDTKLAVARLK